jgi:hypothetical protein
VNLDVVEKRKISNLCWKANPDFPVAQLVA